LFVQTPLLTPQDRQLAVSVSPVLRGINRPCLLDLSVNSAIAASMQMQRHFIDVQNALRRSIQTVIELVA
jgi:hypothetical protein